MVIIDAGKVTVVLMTVSVVAGIVMIVIGGHGLALAIMGVAKAKMVAASKTYFAQPVPSRTNANPLTQS